MNQLVIIGCGAKKKSEACQAHEMYVGPLFVKALRYARSVANDDDIRIMSAKYGLLKLNQVIQPYEYRLTKADIRGLTGLEITVRAQLGEMECDGRPVLMLAGGDYALFFGHVWWNQFQQNPEMERPLLGLGIGQQMKWLKEHTFAPLCIDVPGFIDVPESRADDIEFYQKVLLDCHENRRCREQAAHPHRLIRVRWGTFHQEKTETGIRLRLNCQLVAQDYCTFPRIIN